MISVPSGVRVWLATGHTDMRKGFGSLALLVQETFKRDPHAGNEPAPRVCCKCGGKRSRKLGEAVSKTLKCEPRCWNIIERVREKFACRDCEAIKEPPAPSHPIPRGFAGPSRLAMILVGKFGDHLSLNRQSAAFAREGIELEDSTLADWVGGYVATLDLLLAKLRRHVLAAERLHVDDTTVPVLATMENPNREGRGADAVTSGVVRRPQERRPVGNG